jgi:hypothetical protein
MIKIGEKKTKNYFSGIGTIVPFGILSAIAGDYPAEFINGR